MGYIAVAADDASRIEIERCHANLWSLGLLFGRRATLLDIGLIFEVKGEDAVRELTVAVPGSLVDGQIEDLRDRVLDRKAAGLIFAADTTIDGDEINWGKGTVELVQIDSSRFRAGTLNHRHFSSWVVPFADDLTAGTRYYTRFRLNIRPSRRLIDMGRRLGRRDGITIDVRVADWREAWTVPDAVSLTKRIVPFKGMDFFVIVPTRMALARLTLSEASPPPRYVRLLEGAVWEPYLGRATDLRRSQKLVIYRWTVEEAAEETEEDGVSSDKPFRGFLRFERGRTLFPWRSIVTAVFTTILLAVFLDVDAREWAVDLGDWVVDKARALIIATLVTGFSLAGFALLVRWVGFLRSFAGWGSNKGRAVEGWLYRAFAQK